MATKITLLNDESHGEEKNLLKQSLEAQNLNQLVETVNQGSLEKKSEEQIKKERIKLLWKRGINAAITLGKMKQINDDIKLYGASRNHYSEKLAVGEDEQLEENIP